MRSTTLILATSLALAAPAAASAQGFEHFRAVPKPTRMYLGGAFQVAVPQGEFADNIGTGYGFGGNFIYQLDRQGIFAIRADAGGVIYGQERQRACFPGTCRVSLDINTSNNIFMGSIGPQIMAPTGLFRPYLNGGVGVSYFFTESSLEGSDNSSPFAQSTNYHDAVLSWNAGGGLYIPVYHGRNPVSIDLGANYQWNGKASYLRKGGITDNSDGSISLHPVRSETNLVVFRLGATVGF